jgi:hypothetical protein
VSGRLTHAIGLSSLSIVGLGLVFWWRGGCVRGHDVDAHVTFIGADQRKLTRVTVIAGADKASWPEISAGTTVRSTLFTEGGDTSLFVQFTLDDKQLNWHGPKFPEETGYRIAVRVDSAGIVTERHCTLPCWFL